MTDITGFGLIGHLREMLLASNVSATISAGAIPVLKGALECIKRGHIPGGLKNNRDFAECMVEYDSDISEDLRTILYDPQTAGGLLIAAADGEQLLRNLQAAAIPATQIGQISYKTRPLIKVTK
jgi:selenide, water dikinase